MALSHAHPHAATPGIFLSPTEKLNLTTWSYSFDDISISTRVLTPFWDFCAYLVPDNVAPNLLSLSGLLCVLHAYYLCYRYMDDYPSAVSICAMLLIFMYQTLDAIDGKHARRIRNASPLGELFDHSCDAISCVFVALTVCAVLGIENLKSRWFVTQFFQLAFLSSHFEAFKSRVVHFGAFTGPGEAIFLFECTMLVRATIGWDWIRRPFETVVLPILTPLHPTLYDMDSLQLFALMMCYLYYSALLFMVIKVLTMPRKNYSTRNGLLFCLLIRYVPAFLIQLNLLASELSILEIICDGLFMSILTSDLILAKMSQRELHPWIVVFAMISLFNSFVLLAVVVFYYVAVFYDIAQHLNIPVFSTVTNVYVDGVYDMCHIGHINQFYNALKHGNKLIVGVLSDESVMDYKRKPIMTCEERCAIVRKLSMVHKVIPKTIYPTITEEFIKEHNIHIVCHSEEYDKPDDTYYTIPRKMGMTRVLPRTEGMSTSELIKRMTTRAYEIGKENVEKLDDK
uniref:Cytidyltransferase-like domain-containing protein n=1 Tax=Percolomonas cosmopolitus TaxID=63605 RepID=A0A7S1PGS5_9EUKA|mmetsp:Transcript_6719/g.25171  ORF Transcript_6719/g.25171 Transcript_6719/m.25171 type:complete len:512 (+) Transcript_6719:251-1786(+)|eukprot:CAMPEP_0117441874 /NCGR_PEP_ID=MMETSP0759-20121206/3859_1 /TAXON_ID=63605 /ORGANISM="Percolomonas cosmopolitus, Strain WS" /LENGTH=511 /DNA_ID=CAMNT_0005233741 /DNA_START=199 /DNA_END=1734 /DNA_ORIENTATION=-